MRTRLTFGTPDFDLPVQTNNVVIPDASEPTLTVPTVDLTG
jgi:hypothetical protein